MLCTILNDVIISASVVKPIYLKSLVLCHNVKLCWKDKNSLLACISYPFHCSSILKPPSTIFFACRELPVAILLEQVYLWQIFFFYFIWEYLYLLILEGNFLCGIGFMVDKSFLLENLKNIAAIPVASGFKWEICFHLNCCSPLLMCHFFLAAFKMFVFSLQKCDYDVPWCGIFLCLSCFVIVQVFKALGVCLLPNLGNVWPLFLQIFLCPLPSRFLQLRKTEWGLYFNCSKC